MERRDAGILWAGILLMIAGSASGQTAPGGANGKPAATVVYASDYDQQENANTWSQQTAGGVAVKGMKLLHLPNEEHPSETGTTVMAIIEGANSNSLQLNKLPPHRVLRIRAQLVIWGNWNGNAGAASDRLAISVGDGRTLMDASFSLGTNARQSYPEDYPFGENLAGTGSTPVKDADADMARLQKLGTLYVIDITVPHTGDMLRMDFISKRHQPTAVEREAQWGLGAIQVSVADGPEKALTAEGIRAAIAALENERSAVAMPALRSLLANGDAALPFIRDALAPARDAAWQKDVADNISRLNDDQFAVRESAQAHLISLGNDVRPLITAAIAAGAPAETEARLAQLLTALPPPVLTAKQTRLLQVVNLIGTVEARKLAKQFAPVAAPPTLEDIQGRFHVADDEWAVLSARIDRLLHVIQGMRNSEAYGDKIQKDNSTDAMANLRKLVDNQATPDASLKTAMTALRDARSSWDGVLNDAERNKLMSLQQQLRQVLTVRQEAILMALNVLD